MLMLNLGISGLVAAYVLMAVVLLGVGMRSAWSWKVKAAVIMLTTAFYLVTYFAYPQILGWPTAEKPPQKFRLLASHIERPDKNRGVSGVIYLWLAGIDDLSSPLPPRAYRFAYSDTLHQRVLNATSKLNRGIAQLGEFESNHDTNTGKTKNVPESDKKSVSIVFYDLPDSLFPDR
jgi:hypothetical protein